MKDPLDNPWLPEQYRPYSGPYRPPSEPVAPGSAAAQPDSGSSATRDNVGASAEGSIIHHPARRHPPAGEVELAMDPSSGEVSPQIKIKGDNGHGKLARIRSGMSLASILILVALIHECMPAVVGRASEGMNKVLESWSNSPDDLPPIPKSDDSAIGLNVFAVRVQVRDTDKEAREYIRKTTPSVERLYNRFNDEEKGLWIDRKIIRENFPKFILEPRPDYERDFNGFAAGDASEYTLYIFPYESNRRLREIATECGYGQEDAVSWIKTWSAWREGPESIQTSKCKNGGFCLVIAKHCNLSALGRR